MKRFFFIKLSNGLGNNLFQIVSSFLLFRDYSNVKFFLITPEKDYYALPVIKKLFKSKINFSIVDSSPFFYILINDKTYKIFKYFSIFLKIPFTYLSNGYFEDYRYYINDLELIRSFFSIKNFNLKNDSLVIHLRTGDRLFYKNQFLFRRSFEEFNSIIESFDYKKLYVITDLPSLNEISIKELIKMKFHIKTSSDNAFLSKSVKYINSILSLLNSKGASHFTRSLYDEFCFLVSSKKIIFENSTLAWWAAFLSYSSEVRLSKDWRPWKGKNNKNLSKVPLKKWINW